MASVSYLCRLPHRQVAYITGKDRRAFLQGLISNDITLCQPGQPVYAALLTPQGKFLHDLFISDDGAGFIIDAERVDDLIRRLAMYKLRADVLIENKTDIYEVWAASLVTAPSSPMLYTDPRHDAMGFRVIVERAAAEAKLLPLTDTPLTDFSAYDRHRLSLTVPDGSRDMITSKSTLLECNLDRLNAISWTKGCYMGQELTARMHYRALVKKRLYTVKLAVPAPAPETPIYLDGIDIGDMRSSCGDIGLALLNCAKAEGITLTLTAENFKS